MMNPVTTYEMQSGKAAAKAAGINTYTILYIY
jgi:hypothetical protein